MKNPINKNVFDTRDLIEYKEFLESEICDIINDEINDSEHEALDIDECIDWTNKQDEPRCYTADIEIEHYNKIKDFCEELENYAPDFTYGEAVIHEDYFTEYCEELLKDCGYIPENFPSWICLDFEETAENMKVDYASIDYGNETYYIR